MKLSNFPELHELSAQRWFKIALLAAPLCGFFFPFRDLPSFSSMNTLPGWLFCIFMFAICVVFGTFAGWTFRGSPAFPFRWPRLVVAFSAIGSLMGVGGGARELLAGTVPFHWAGTITATGFLLTYAWRKRDTPQP